MSPRLLQRHHSGLCWAKLRDIGNTGLTVTVCSQGRRRPQRLGRGQPPRGEEKAARIHLKQRAEWGRTRFPLRMKSWHQQNHLILFSFFFSSRIFLSALFNKPLHCMLWKFCNPQKCDLIGGAGMRGLTRRVAHRICWCYCRSNRGSKCTFHLMKMEFCFHMTCPRDQGYHIIQGR